MRVEEKQPLLNPEEDYRGYDGIPAEVSKLMGLDFSTDRLPVAHHAQSASTSLPAPHAMQYTGSHDQVM